jgi:hypothetical protein
MTTTSKRREVAPISLGFHPIRKCIVVVQKLAYGVVGDHVDENIQMGEFTCHS